MLNWRVPWWMYLIAAVYLLTFFFNARQEGWGPANAGWAPAWPAPMVASVVPGSPMDRAGLKAGDILKAVNGQPLNGMPDWFVARAHFELDRPIDLQILRGEQHISLRMTITRPAWRTSRRAQLFGAAAFYLVRLILLLLAILVAFSQPERLRARLLGLMFAVGSVAEGYPSAGWAAALHHLPPVLAVPICLATASCLMSSLVWLPFCTTFRKARLSERWRWSLVLVPGVAFGLPIAASAIAMIYVPSSLMRPWPELLSATPVRLVQDIAGVSPLLFLNILPAYRPVTQSVLLDLWAAVNALYLTAGFLILVTSYRQLRDARERHGVGRLLVAVGIFGLIAVHNIVGRNWNDWFRLARPGLFSPTASLATDTLFLIVPLTLAYYVLTDDRRAGERSTREVSTSG